MIYPGRGIILASLSAGNHLLYEGRGVYLAPGENEKGFSFFLVKRSWLDEAHFPAKIR